MESVKFKFGGQQVNGNPNVARKEKKDKQRRSNQSGTLFFFRTVRIQNYFPSNTGCSEEQSKEKDLKQKEKGTTFSPQFVNFLITARYGFLAYQSENDSFYSSVNLTFTTAVPPFFDTGVLASCS